MVCENDLEGEWKRCCPGNDQTQEEGVLSGLNGQKKKLRKDLL